ncbi:MAG: hypothetical protein WKF34_07435 [Pyrinomonadaceae bacterium]
MLGRNFAWALEECLGRSSFDVAHIRELSSLARAWLIIDDYIRDTELNAKARGVVHELLQRIEAEVLTTGPYLEPNFSRFWKRRKLIQENTYRQSDFTDFYSYKINKCSLVFLCLDLPAIRSAKNYSLFSRCLHHYFFALQLIDDFQDMQEDFRSRRNDNLFVARTTHESFRCVSDRRVIILRALVPYIIENLVYLKTMGGIYGKYYEQAKSYLESKLPLSVPHFPELFPKRFRDYCFDITVLSGLPLARARPLITITAEEAHTLSQIQITDE